MKTKQTAQYLSLIKVGIAMIVMALSNSVLSDEKGLIWEDDDHSYDQARRAVFSAKILPIKQILEQFKNEITGDILEIELEKEHGQWVYEIKYLDTDGRRFEAYLDAQTAQLLSVKKD